MYAAATHHELSLKVGAPCWRFVYGAKLRMDSCAWLNDRFLLCNMFYLSSYPCFVCAFNKISRGQQCNTASTFSNKPEHNLHRAITTVLIQIYGMTMLFFAVCLGSTAFFAILQQPVSVAIGRVYVGSRFWHLRDSRLEFWLLLTPLRFSVSVNGKRSHDQRTFELVWRRCWERFTARMLCICHRRQERCTGLSETPCHD